MTGSSRTFWRTTTLLSFLLLGTSRALGAQGTLEDYRRAVTVQQRYAGLTVGLVQGGVNWIDSTDRFWYRVSVTGGNRFYVVDPDAWTKQPAFDHDRLARTLSTVAAAQYTAITLPFNTFNYVNNRGAIEADAGASRYRCLLNNYTCTRIDSASGRGGAAGGRGAAAGRGGAGGRGGGAGGRAAGAGAAGRGGAGGRGGGAGGTPARPSPDGNWEAFIQNFNVAVRPTTPAGGTPNTSSVVVMSSDGKEGNAYSLNSVIWAPDSRKFVASRVRPGAQRRVMYVLSSPADRTRDNFQPQLDSSGLYRKPGDSLDISRPSLFDIETRRQIRIDTALFLNPYTTSAPNWRSDSRAFTFEFNQRGHKVFRVLEVNGTTGAIRPIIDEETSSFFFYTAPQAGLSDGGKKWRRDLDDGKEILWMSERDGWNHLYLIDGVTGRVKNQITKGNWIVRFVDSVDVAKRQVYFRGLGVNPTQDPYFFHFYRINFDGTGMVAYTEGNGSHTVEWSPSRRFYIDTYSRVDMPPVVELKRESDRRTLALEKGDMTAALATGWKPPEVFVSKGRDGVTDIWGIIVRPFTFDPNKRYPVIEQIYAGPQGSFVPKTWGGGAGLISTAELGFVLVQIDGMGTSNRSKAFHEVAWKNLKDAGFPDRILWHKAVNAKYPWYDISRVGVYGGSAGGQNAMGALLFHGDFYDAAFASSGCHDNRMDKIWWNELWMGEVGAHYDSSSNVVNANRLKGHLFLAVGEHDTNVDPASTMQVVDVLARAGKDFDLLVVPNGGHGQTGTNGTRKRNDFFVRWLLGVNPPDWNSGITDGSGRGGRGGGGGGAALEFPPDDPMPLGFFERPPADFKPWWM